MKPTKLPEKTIADEKAKAVVDLLKEAVEYERYAFEHDEEVNGADLVDFFVPWRNRVKKILKVAPKERVHTNKYECPDCGHRWKERWTASCDSECPDCEARNISPSSDEDLMRGGFQDGTGR